MSVVVDHHDDGASADWMTAADREHSARLHLTAVYEGRWLVAVLLAISVAAAGAYLVRAPAVYESDAQLLITPVTSRDTTYRGLSVLRSTGDPGRDMQTALRLVTTVPVARRTAALPGIPASARAVRRSVTVSPVPESNLLSVRARARSPRAAQRLADGFARAAVAERMARLRAQIDRRARGLRAPSGGDRADREVDARLAALDLLRSAPDPTIHLEVPAELPSAPVKPRPVVSLAVASAGGLLLGIVAVILLQVAQPRILREHQLRARFALPVLARVRVAPGRRVLPSTQLTRSLLDLARPAPESARSMRLLALTAAAPDDHKTTAAIGLARAVAAGGTSVLLVDADVRRPRVASRLDMTPPAALLDVLLEDVPLAEAVVPAPGAPPGLSVLAAARPEPLLADLLGGDLIDRLARRAGDVADCMVMDAPPVRRTADAAGLATKGATVLVSVRLGATRMADLRRLADLCADTGVTPAGFVVIGRARSHGW